MRALPRRKSLALVGLYASMMGCATISGPVSTRKAGEAPALDTQTEHSVGEVLYEVFDYQEIAGIHTAETVMLAHMMGHGTIDQSSFLGAFEHKGIPVYCTNDAVYQIALNPNRKGVCLADRSHKGKLDSWEIMVPGSSWLNLQHPVAFTTAKIMAAGNGFRWELLYEGISGSTVNILYREFIGDLVRPGFQQDLRYNLSADGPTDVSFRGARLRIVTADNNTIKYRVLAGLKR